MIVDFNGVFLFNLVSQAVLEMLLELFSPRLMLSSASASSKVSVGNSENTKARDSS